MASFHLDGALLAVLALVVPPATLAQDAVADPAASVPSQNAEVSVPAATVPDTTAPAAQAPETGETNPSDEAIQASIKAAALAGHNAWMLTSCALVLFMTAPGLAMFYGGLVRRKNVLSIMMQCVFLMGMMTVVWAVVGYSLAFAAQGPTSATWNSYS